MKNILFISIIIICFASFSNIKEEGIIDLEKNSNQLIKELEKQENIDKYREIENINFREKQVNIEDEVVENTSVFFIEKITYVDDDKLLTENDKYGLSSFFVYKELGIKEINDLLNNTNKLLISKGYITSRAIANTTNIFNGELIIEIIAGKIDEISVISKEREEVGKIITGLPIRRNKVLNIRDIDTLVDRYNKNSSNNLEIEIEPSEKENHLNILGKNEIKGKTSIFVGFNNYGDEDGGKND